MQTNKRAPWGAFVCLQATGLCLPAKGVAAFRADRGSGSAAALLAKGVGGKTIPAAALRCAEIRSAAPPCSRSAKRSRAGVRATFGGRSRSLPTACAGRRLGGELNFSGVGFCVVATLKRLCHPVHGRVRPGRRQIAAGHCIEVFKQARARAWGANVAPQRTWPSQATAILPCRSPSWTQVAQPAALTRENCQTVYCDISTGCQPVPFWKAVQGQ
jgi:hypothetical protein